MSGLEAMSGRLFELPAMPGGLMPTVSLYQPYAQLIAVKAKPYETRSWAPPAKYVGQRIAIHAGLNRKCEILETDRKEDIEAALGLPVSRWLELPFGAVICTAKLVGAYQVQRHRSADMCVDFRDRVPGSPPDLCAVQGLGVRFGNFNQGRWMWELEDARPVTPPVVTRGFQGFWQWTPPVEGAA